MTINRTELTHELTRINDKKAHESVKTNFDTEVWKKKMLKWFRNMYGTKWT